LATYSCARRLHIALDAGAALQGLHRLLDDRLLGELAHADARQLAGGHAQRQLLLLEVDHEQLESHARDLLLLDADDAADTVSRVDDELAGFEAMALAHGFFCAVMS
jgi:hypothetical protein